MNKKIIILNITLLILNIAFMFITLNRNKYDINNDGKADIIDYIKMQKYIMKKDEISDDNNYDINKDGKVNSKDILDLKNYLLKEE